MLIILLVILLVVGLTVLLIIWLVVALVVVWLVISPSAELIRHVGTFEPEILGKIQSLTTFAERQIPHASRDFTVCRYTGTSFIDYSFNFFF